MFSKIYGQWSQYAAFGLALITSFGGVGSASAQTLTGVLSNVGTHSVIPLTSDASGTIAAGTIVTVHGTFFSSDENIGMWINLPSGTTLASNALGQTDTEVIDGVAPVDAMASADDTGAFSYTLNTAGLPGGTYSLVAHGLSSGVDEVLQFSVSQGPALQISTSGSASVAAGTAINMQGTAFEAGEYIGLWINIPSGAVIPSNSLGQDNTVVDGTVVPLNAMASADDTGAFSYTLDTGGLPGGNYSLVAHGLNSKLEEVLIFTVK